MLDIKAETLLSNKFIRIGLIILMVGLLLYMGAKAGYTLGKFWYYITH